MPARRGAQVLEVAGHEEVQLIAVAHDADVAVDVLELGRVDLEREEMMLDLSPVSFSTGSGWYP